VRTRGSFTSDHGGRSFPAIVEVIDVNAAEPEAEPTNRPQQAAIPLLLAVIGSVAGALVSSAFSSSQNLALLGAALGAAIPPLVSVAGPFTHLRAWTGVLIAVIALVVTYGGFTVQEKAAGVDDNHTTFPVPRPNTTGRRPTPPTTGSPTSGFTCEGSLCISWSPQQLHCSNDPCERVTVRSEGDELLVVTGIKFTGQAASRLWQKGNCKGESLHQDEECSFTVRVKPGASGRAQIRIQQNLQGPASLVNVEVDALPTPSQSSTDPTPPPATPTPSPTTTGQ
jgi:hypothetical protein